MKARRGFTLIEVLVVLGIILVLVGMVFVGVSQMGRAGKKSATKITLENLRSMLAEYDAVTRGRRTTPAYWVWNGAPADGVHSANVVTPGTTAT